MCKTVEMVKRDIPLQKKALRVAAYARVSGDGDAMHHSLSQQVSYYSSLIQNHPGWVYAGVYADEAKTGTKAKREQFQKMIGECRAGKIDLIITKSVSRFARNTLDLLSVVRELKEYGIDVHFEEQNIYTLSANGELLLTFLASYAQEESRSASENQIWHIRKNFEKGIPWCSVMYGYRLKEGRFTVVPEQAKIVKRIFKEYLDGRGMETIAKGLNCDGIVTGKGYSWNKNAVSRILRNYSYTGSLMLQRYYSENHITKKKMLNDGVLKKYHAVGTHEAIIDSETFGMVQEEIKRRADKFKGDRKEMDSHAFTSLITCALCGKHYRRKTTATGPVWICSTYNSKGKNACPSKAIPEKTLIEVMSDISLDNVSGITAKTENRLSITFGNCDLHEIVWKDRSRSESWTEDMKSAARRKTLERSKK